MTENHKPGWAFWTATALVVMLAYPLSFGPACWIQSRIDFSNVGIRAIGFGAFEVTYSPIIAYASDDERPLVGLIFRYADFGAEGTLYISPEREIDWMSRF